MKLTRYLLAFPLLSFSADTWQPFAIDQRVAVQLPAQPTEADLTKLAPGRALGHTRMWALSAPEGGYMLMRIPTKGGFIGKQDTAGRRAFYAGVLTSVLRNESGLFLTKAPFSTAGGQGMEFEYKGIHRGTGKRVVKYSRSLVVDSISYAFYFTPADLTDSLGLAGAEQRRRFFNSVVVKP